MGLVYTDVLRRVLFDGVVSFVDLFDDESFFYLVQEYHGTAWRGGEKIGNPPVVRNLLQLYSETERDGRLPLYRNRLNPD